MFCEIGPETGHTLPAEVWMSALFMCLGLGYIFNFLGVFLDVFFSYLREFRRRI